ncbi:MAG: GNAT family N-acetyltransferase [Propionibacteriaceae bacterium]|nr:GNAT family N-acetyltransferase [Propionibacteriaceae bacterium]
MSAPDSVRLAMPTEAVDIARLQRRSWSRSPEMAPALAAFPADQAVRTWHDAIVKPPLAHCRVLVALAGGQVVGFIVTGPSNDPDAEVDDGMIAEFVTDDDLGDHASRLMNAAIDTLRADGYETATWWVRSDDDALRTFLVASGWGADGAHRALGFEDEAEAIKQVRLRTRIAGEDI